MSSTYGLPKKWAVVRNDRSIPGGLRIVGLPYVTREEAEWHATHRKRPLRVMHVDEVIELRIAAMGLTDA